MRSSLARREVIALLAAGICWRDVARLPDSTPFYKLAHERYNSLYWKIERA
jgi:hypothetical protein